MLTQNGAHIKEERKKSNEMTSIVLEYRDLMASYQR